MRPLAVSRAAALLLTTALPLAAATDDWPQWRGPDRNGVSRETGWAPKGRAVWDRQVGLGYSTVSVAGGKLYTTGFEEAKGEDVVWCIDAATGDLVWEQRYPAKKWDKYHGGGTQTTPSVDGDRVYVMNREGRFSCFDATTGKVNWRHELVQQHGLTLPTWGFSASPLVLPDQVVLNVGKVIAFDKEKGDVIWKTERDYGHAYSTPSAANMVGKDVLAVFCGSGLVMLEQKTGAQIATHEWKTQYDVNAASPVIVDSERIFISSGYGHGAAMLAFSGESLELLWEIKGMRNQMSTSIAVGKHFYGFDDKVLKCIDMEAGKEAWSARGLGMGALSAAGDRLIVMSEDGEIVVVKADPAGYAELAREKVVDGGVCWTMPILVGNKIYARNSLGHLVCRDHTPTDQ